MQIGLMRVITGWGGPTRCMDVVNSKWRRDFDAHITVYYVC
jgi:hypothetical protein